MRHQRQGLPRVLRKARRIAQTDLDREFNGRLAVINRAMQDAKEKANAEYESVVGKARRERIAAYKKAEATAVAAREALLKEIAASMPKEPVEAVAS